MEDQMKEKKMKYSTFLSIFGYQAWPLFSRENYFLLLQTFKLIQKESRNV